MDVDAVANQWLNDYEEKLFFQADANDFQIIAKTDMQAPSVYRQVSLNNMPVTLPLPALFSIHADSIREDSAKLSKNRTLILYDNAGEHFQAGADSAAAPGTKHLLHAEGILFLFDPTEDPRFRSVLNKEAAGGLISSRIHRQDVLLVEMISRIRKYSGMSSTERIRKTVMVGISKADLLKHFLPFDSDPWFYTDDKTKCALDLDVISRMSDAVRSLLDTYVPEIVTTVESFSEKVLYLPNSALGHNPAKEGVRPCDINPRWVEVPMLYILAGLGYVPTNRDMTGR